MLYVLRVDVQEGYEDRYLQLCLHDNLREAVNEHLWFKDHTFVPFDYEDEYSDCYVNYSLGVTQHSSLEEVYETFGPETSFNRYEGLTCGLTPPA